jgi:hypothetical protein
MNIKRAAVAVVLAAGVMTLPAAASVPQKVTCHHQVNYSMTNQQHTFNATVSTDNCGVYMRGRIRCLLVGGGFRYNYSAWKNFIGANIGVTTSCDDMAGQPDQAAMQYNMDTPMKVDCWGDGQPTFGTCGN